MRRPDDRRRLGARWGAGGRGGAADEGRVAGGTGTTSRAIEGGSTTDEVGNIVVGQDQWRLEGPLVKRRG
jgi:hypothetical protein